MASELCILDRTISFFGLSVKVSIASIPLRRRLKITCCSCTRSPSVVGRLVSKSVSTTICFLTVSLWIRLSTSSMTSLTFRAILSRAVFLKSARICRTTSPAAFPSRMILSAATFALAKSAGSADNHCMHARPFATTALRGWLTSCAMEAASSATVAICVARESRL